MYFDDLADIYVHVARLTIKISLDSNICKYSRNIFIYCMIKHIKRYGHSNICYFDNTEIYLEN